MPNSKKMKTKDERGVLVYLLFSFGILLVLFGRKAEANRQDILSEILDDDPRTAYDPRIVTCEDLLRDGSTRVFSSDDLDDFSQIFIDSSRQQLIVGSRNHLLRLSLSDLTQLELLRYAPDNYTVSNCVAKGQSKADCHNYIRVLLVHKNQTFVCGTNAFAPQCSWRQVDNLQKVLQWVPGVAKCPFNPHHNATFIMTSDGNFYGATVTDFAARDPAIYRVMGSSKTLRTVQYNSRWLNEPDFVSAYEISDFVYFFFRETAVEYINCGKSIYSRVARVCKSDNGGNILLGDNWTTFTKARLNCSLPGLYPFYFSELQDTYFDMDEQLLYATFTTSPTSIYGSSVCVYNMTSFDQAFSGSFKYQSHPEMAWTRVTNNSPNLQCNSVGGGRRSSDEADQTPVQRLLVDAQKFQMMDVAVQPTALHPFTVAENERFTKIVVDRVRVQSHSKESTVSVVFLATLEGAIHKMVAMPTQPDRDESSGDGDVSATSCLVERILLPCGAAQATILSLKLDREQKMLYVATKDKIYRISVHRCSRFVNKLECSSSGDPYCDWNDTVGQCLATGNRNLTSCPVLSNPVDGEWCPWSAWQLCQQTGHSIESGQCWCRTRSCDCPRPRFDGGSCSGKSVEVTNCTVDGNWTEWSSWSGCSVTCGAGKRTRQRTCSNPQPRFGGQPCVGENEQSIICLNDVCPPEYQLPAVDGHWSSWTEWSACSVRCGGGHSLRSRGCNNPRPQNGGRGCVGNDRDWKQCNLGQCDEVRKLSDWSPWLRINSSRDGYVTERFRCVCRASVSNQMQLRQPQIKTSTRYCSASGEDCDTGHLDIPDVDGGWSPWSPWTECDVLCGSGIRSRERQCGSPAASGNGRECTGHSRELETCNTHSCQGQWSCWSDFGACSASCGQGRKWRKRQCESEPPGDYYSVPCKGGDLQEVTCTTPSCDSIVDLPDWTAWSTCDDKGSQQRKRKANCTAINCNGPDVELRQCHEATGTDAVALDRLKQSSDGSFRAHHLVIVGIVSFIVGGVAIAAVALYCWRYCRCSFWNAGLGKPSNCDGLHRFDAKPNNYFSPLQFKWKSPKSPKDEEPASTKPYQTPLAADCGCGTIVRSTDSKYGTLSNKDGSDDCSVSLTRYGVSTDKTETVGRNKSAPPQTNQVTPPTMTPDRYDNITPCREENNRRVFGERDYGQRLLPMGRRTSDDYGARRLPQPYATDGVPTANLPTGATHSFSRPSGKVSPIGFDNIYLAWPDGGRCFNYTSSLQRNKKRANRCSRTYPDDPGLPRYATVERNGSIKLGSISRDFDRRSSQIYRHRPGSQSDDPDSANPERFRFDPAVATGGIDYYGTMPVGRPTRPVQLPRIQREDTAKERSDGSVQSLPSWTNYNKMTVGQATLKRNALASVSTATRAYED